MATLALAAAAAGALALAATPYSQKHQLQPSFATQAMRITPSPSPLPRPVEEGVHDGWVVDWSSPEFFEASKDKGKQAAQDKKQAEQAKKQAELEAKKKRIAAKMTGGGLALANAPGNKNKTEATKGSKDKDKDKGTGKDKDTGKGEKMKNVPGGPAPSMTKRRYVEIPPPLFPNKSLSQLTKEERGKATKRQQFRMRAATNNVVVQIAGFYDVAAGQIAEARAKKVVKPRVDAAVAKLASLKILIASADKIAVQATKDTFPVEDLGVAQGYARTARGLVDAIAADLFIKAKLLTNPPVTRSPANPNKPPTVAGDLLPSGLLGPQVNILSWSNVKSKNGPPALTVSNTSDTRVSLNEELSSYTQQFQITPTKMPGAYNIQDGSTGRYMGANKDCNRPQLLTSGGNRTLWAFKLVSGAARQPVYVMRVFSPDTKCMRYLSLSNAVDDVVLSPSLDQTSERMSWVVLLSSTQPFDEHRIVTVAPVPTAKPGKTAEGVPIGSLSDMANLGGSQQALVNSGSMSNSGNQAQQTSNSVGDISYNVTYDTKNQQDGNSYGTGGGYLYGGGGYGGGGTGFGAAAGGPNLTLQGGSSMQDSLNTTLTNSNRSQGLVDNSIKLGADTAKSFFDTESVEAAANAFEYGDVDGEVTMAPSSSPEKSADSDSGPASDPGPPMPPAPTMPQTAPKKKFPVGGIVALVLLGLLLIVGGWYGWKWWQRKKAAGANNSRGNNSNTGNNGGGGGSNSGPPARVPEMSPPRNSGGNDIPDMYPAASPRPQAAGNGMFG